MVSDISFEFYIDHPPSATYQIAYDNLPDIVEAVPIVQHYDRTVKSTNSGEVIVDRWNVNALEALPVFLSSFMNLGVVKIETKSRWNDSDMRVDFELKSINWENLVENCDGTIQFFEEDSKTLIKISCDFTIILTQIPGFPNFLAKQLSKRLNSFSENRVTAFIPDIKKGILRNLS